ncbi:hypothetical protein Y032_0014g2455 [Ancylostoma ceylanicum]|uniref:Uncharacterized protein n=1 Tax=Ancylostoma ceylanicum TaxID=53326 RepID=A0A016V9K0_9BILA|nr:hypothetical protein Y032_0014g2455 [Ancylostoma ceylanicum]
MHNLRILKTSRIAPETCSTKSLFTTCFPSFLPTSCHPKACRQLAKPAAALFASCRHALSRQLVDKKEQKQVLNKLQVEHASDATKELTPEVLRPANLLIVSLTKVAL